MFIFIIYLMWGACTWRRGNVMIIGNELIQHDIVSGKLRRLVESHFVEISKDMFCPA